MTSLSSSSGGAFDVIVVGAGMAGVSAAATMTAAGARVAVIEAEDRPAVHSTGRSAALFSENYGSEPVRRLTIASRAFLTSPPPGFSDAALLSPRGVLLIARSDQLSLVEAEAETGHSLVPNISRIGVDRALALCPALSGAYVAGAAWEPDADDIDVDALLQGYLRAFRAGGGALLTGFRLSEGGVARRGGVWTVADGSGQDISAPVAVDAAGAWADRVAAAFGARPLGLQPRRRTAFIFDPPAGADPSGWPMVIDASEEFYFKPEGGRLLGSPGDETPSEPVDARPEEIDVALALDRIGAAMGTELRYAHRPWAGLRTFAADRTPVVGPDPEIEGLVWLAGQGGYGIQTAPAMAAAAAGLVLEGRLPHALMEAGLSEEILGPARLRG